MRDTRNCNLCSDDQWKACFGKEESKLDFPLSARPLGWVDPQAYPVNLSEEHAYQDMHAVGITL